MHRGRIIFLNGVSSSGKTTLANKLVEKLPDYFHIGLDNFDVFINSMEDRALNHLIPVETEYFFHRVIAMFSDKGINLVVDHILHDDLTNRDCIRVLTDYPVLFVGVHCPLKELERREEVREDRYIGQAKKQLEYVHKNEIYDIEVNTFIKNAEDCSNKIIKLLNSADYNDGWLRNCKKYI